MNFREEVKKLLNNLTNHYILKIEIERNINENSSMYESI